MFPQNAITHIMTGPPEGGISVELPGNHTILYVALQYADVKGGVVKARLTCLDNGVHLVYQSYDGAGAQDEYAPIAHNFLNYKCPGNVVEITGDGPDHYVAATIVYIPTSPLTGQSSTTPFIGMVNGDANVVFGLGLVIFFLATIFGTYMASIFKQSKKAAYA